MGSHVVVGGSGFVGSALVERLAAAGEDVTVVDRQPPRPLRHPEHGATVSWKPADLLMDPPTLPEGRVVLVYGSSMPRPRRFWTLALDNALTTARLAPFLADREVVLLSSVEVYGTAPAPLCEDSSPRLPVARGAVERWCDRAMQRALQPCPPWRSHDLCQDLADLDPSGRWVYAITKLAQEILTARTVDTNRLTVLRAANVFGLGQARVLARLVHAARIGAPMQVRRLTTRTFVSVDRVVDSLTAPLGAGLFNLGGQQVTLAALAELVSEELNVACAVEFSDAADGDSCGVVDDQRLCERIGPETALVAQLRAAIGDIARDESPLFVPPLAVVVPPRPEHPELVADRQQGALWSGVVKHGGPWTLRLEALLRELLGLDESHRVIATASGTAALRLAILAVAGPAEPGATALLPSFTFAATGEVLSQLGYRLRFVDVDPGTWTLDPVALEETLSRDGGDLVVSVDALGNPADYEQLRVVCRRHGVPLVADSAPSLGGSYNGVPVGAQAEAHAFSMSFAKVISAGGAGGALVVPARLHLETPMNWLRSSMLHEVHAVAALDQLEVLDGLVARRREVAAIYNAAAARWAGVTPQETRALCGHAYVHWVARFEHAAGLDRDGVARALEGLGVQTKPYYAPVLHHSALATETGRSLPVTELLAAEALALPMSSEMTPEDADNVVMAVDRVVLGRADPADRSLLGRVPAGRPPLAAAAPTPPEAPVAAAAASRRW